MQSTAPVTGLSELETAVLRTVAYSDLFDYPLTLDEVHRWLPIAASRDEVESLLASRALHRYVVYTAPYLCLRERETTIRVRRQRAHDAARLMQRARSYGRLIARLPCVRMVAVTGSIAIDNAEEGADLDYLIVTAPGRVWLARAMTMVIVRLAALRGVTLCPNYLLSESAIALPARDAYTARELLQMAPVAGFGVYRRMLEVNAWWREWLPNAEPPTTPPDRPPTLSRRLAEALLGTRPFDAIERLLLCGKGAELRAQAASSEALFDEHMCKGHFDAWRERTQRRLDESLRRLLEARP